MQDAISDCLNEYGMDYGRKDMIVTNGGSEALTMIFMSILNPGDEVIIAEPFYTNYHTFATSVSGKVIPITTKAEDGYGYLPRRPHRSSYHA
ncbi:MAG: aminotransferase class I/II-fold pyridoxal phosphate-dependent enzyme [Anaerovoracaceae bacterium]